MTVQATIEQKIMSSLAPSHLEVINESHMHKVPPGSELHFKVIVVSDHFDGASRIKRQQAVNRILADEFGLGDHVVVDASDAGLVLTKAVAAVKTA